MAAFNCGIRTMNPRLQQVFRQSSRPQGQLRPMFRQRRSHIILLYDGRSPVVPVSRELPRFANNDFVQSRIQSIVVATQPYPSSPESCTSTVCVDLDAFLSEGSG